MYNIKYLENGIKINEDFLSLSEIVKNCNDIKIKKQDLVLLKIEWTGRGGEVYEWRTYGREIAQEIIELLVDKEVYFGEIWGKHSEVYGNIEHKDFKIVTKKKEIVEFLKDYPAGSNYNYSFIETLIDKYEEDIEYENELDEDYIDDIERLKSIY